jgi:predicted acetyltransferase
LPEYRNKGLAGDMWRGIMKISKAQGAQVWELFCFDKEEAFWSKKGFKQQRCLMRKEVPKNGRMSAMSTSASV